uniref:Odorant binding protein 12 n=1 Tax=Anomala corpulenta TaxID=931571 RepID=A0A0E3Y746_9SCAR|nr:odorant binding protein 12 [Anomala corpulenta]
MCSSVAKFYILGIWIYSTLILTKALECGLSSSQNQDELRRYTDICMKKNLPINGDQIIENTSMGQQGYDSSYEDDSKPSSSEDSMSSKEHAMNSLREDSINDSMNRNGDNNLRNNTEITDDCVIRCVLKQLGMVDPSGYPDHSKISQNLIKGAENRELKDFLQDSTDDCFQMMEQDEHMDSCSFSTQLIKCLAEKGKSNCADWPMSDVPFSHLF